MQNEATEQFDVVVIGAGLSGIGSAWHLMHRCPDRSFVILESRHAIGGTWDLFRYPGIRSDSDMHTLGYAFKPWTEAKAIADGHPFSGTSTRRLTSTESANTCASGTGSEARTGQATMPPGPWEAEHEGGVRRIACRMLLLCGGYYNYENPNRPTWNGEADFRGSVVHPQFWPEDLNYRGRNIVVIGSGATAMTLVPAMAMNGARHVVMVQRSPTYVLSWPSQDRIANFLRAVLPDRLAYAITRWKNVKGDLDFYHRTRTEPKKVKDELIAMVRQALGPEYDIDKHFTPRYDPWDQRLCLIPDDDLFNVINDGTASIRTGAIDRFTKEGLRLVDGEVLRADIIVVATGLRLQLMNGVSLRVDGRSVNPPDHWTYKGMMLSDVPNLIQTFGYINASWTLRADLTAEFACRLINELDRTGKRQATPRLSEEEKESMPARPWIDDFSAGYIRRDMHRFPRQGDRNPWRNTQDYGEDRKIVKHAPLDDGVLELSSPHGMSGAFGRRRSDLVRAA